MTPRAIGVDALIRESEERMLQEAMEQARHPELSRGTLLEGLKKQIASKQRWLDTISSGRGKRPDNEIQSRQQELAVLVQARDQIARGGRDDTKPPT